MTACPGCGESNAEAAVVCWACGKPLLGRVVGNCPCCRAHLRELVSDGVSLSGCEGCGGVWVKPRQLDALLLQPAGLQDAVLRDLKRIRRSASPFQQEQLLCPGCGLMLFDRSLGMLTREPGLGCPQCEGLFLDQHLLEDILCGQRRAVR